MARRFVVACKSALVAAAALVVFAPALAGAQALTSAQAGCVNTMNKSGTKVAATQGKENSSCVKGVGSGKIVGTVDACIVADSKGKISKAEQKTIDGDSGKCLPPLPPYGYTGASAVNTAAVEGEIDLLESVFGSPANPGILTDPDGAACQAAVGKSYEKLASTRGKEFTSCKSSGFKLGTITNASGLVACLTSDEKGKIDSARGKITSAIDGKCAAVSLATAFPGCSAQAANSADLTDCIATKTECSMCLILSAMDGLSAQCDSLDDGTVNGTCRQCVNGFVDDGETCDDNNVTPGDGCNASCQVEAGFKCTGDPSVCAIACGDGVTDVGLGEECDDGNTVDGDGCDQDCRIQGAACPTKGELTLLAATGKSCTTNADCIAGSTCDIALGRCVTTTELDTGWTGISHDADINDQVVVTGDLVCPGPGPTCGQCEVVGIETDGGFCRCASDIRAKCDQPFEADSDDCGGGQCVCYFGPPLPLSAGNTPACVVNRYAEDISGTANVDTGAGRVEAKLASIVYLGETLIQPCPVCGGTCTAPAGKVGNPCGQDINCDTSAGAGDGVCGNYDAVAKDGLRGGTCFGGDNNGQNCDVDAVNTTFPAPQGGGSSLDCEPAAGKNVSGTGLKLVLSQTTGTASLPAAALTCNFGFGQCPCGQCSGDSSLGCTSNADCGASGPCVTDSSERPNSCDLDGICTPTGGGEGVCLANLPDLSCDGVVRANGEGFISCLSNADCLPVNIGVAGGNCTLSKARECFLDPISATGVQNADTPLGVAAFCVPATSNSGINTVAGLPGPARVKNQAKSRLFCANNLANLYTPGVGCP